MPVICCTLGTTSDCNFSMVSAPMRTTTSYGPVTYSDVKTPGSVASCLAMTSARPTSVWISMNASTTGRFSSSLAWPLQAAVPAYTDAGCSRRQGPNVPQVGPGVSATEVGQEGP